MPYTQIELSDDEIRAISAAIAAPGGGGYIDLTIERIMWLADRGLLTRDEQQYLYVEATASRPVKFRAEQFQEMARRRAGQQSGTYEYYGNYLRYGERGRPADDDTTGEKPPDKRTVREDILARAKDQAAQFIRDYLGGEPNAGEAEQWATNAEAQGLDWNGTYQYLNSNIGQSEEAKQIRNGTIMRRRDRDTSDKPPDKPPVTGTFDEARVRQAVKRYYTSYIGREPTEDELTRWVTRAKAQNLEANALDNYLYSQIYNSPEAVAYRDKTITDEKTTTGGGDLTRLKNEGHIQAGGYTYLSNTDAGYWKSQDSWNRDIDRLLAEGAIDAQAAEYLKNYYGPDKTSISTLQGKGGGDGDKGDDDKGGKAERQQSFPKPAAYVPPTQYEAAEIPAAAATKAYRAPRITTETYPRLPPPPVIEAAEYVPPERYEPPSAEYELPPSEQARLDRLYAAQMESALYELARENDDVLRDLLQELNERGLLYTSAVSDRAGDIFGKTQGKAREAIIRENKAQRYAAEEAARKDYWERLMSGQEFRAGQEQYATGAREAAVQYRTTLTAEQIRNIADYLARQREYDISQNLAEATAEETATMSRAELAERQREYDVSTREEQRRTNIDQSQRAAAMQEAAEMARAGLYYDASKYLLSLEETRTQREQDRYLELERLGLSRYEIDLMEGYRRSQLAEEGRQFDTTTAEGRRQYDAALAEQQREYNLDDIYRYAGIDEERRQYDKDYDLRVRQFLDDVYRYGIDSSLRKWQAEEDKRQFDESITEEARRYNETRAYEYRKLQIESIIDMLQLTTNEEIEMAKIAFSYYESDAETWRTEMAAKYGLTGTMYEVLGKLAGKGADWLWEIIFGQPREEPKKEEPKSAAGVTVTRGEAIRDAGTGQKYGEQPATYYRQPEQRAYGEQRYTEGRTAAPEYAEKRAYTPTYRATVPSADGARTYETTGYYPEEQEQRKRPRPLPGLGATTAPRTRSYSSYY